MKHFRIILFFLLLGAIVNVAVAWGCALFIDAGKLNMVGGASSFTNTSAWRIQRVENFGSTLITSTHERGDFSSSVSARLLRPRRTPKVWNFRWGHLDQPSERYVSLVEKTGQNLIEHTVGEARGWPWRSLWIVRRQYIEGIDNSDIDSVRGGIVMPLPVWVFSGARVLPLRPIVIGFASNTFLYTAIFWILFPGRYALRSDIRHEQGLCVKCEYDLRGVDHDVCPECGEPRCAK